VKVNKNHDVLDSAHKEISNTHTWRGTGTAIKSGGVKLVSCEQTIMIELNVISKISKNFSGLIHFIS
jgi:hypothetical protein